MTHIRITAMTARPAPQIPGTHHQGGEVHLLREVMRTHQAIVNTFARSVGAPASRLGLMRLLAIAQGRLGTTDLARRLGVHPAAVTRQLKELEGEGLATRSADASDGRRNSVRLTPRGLETFRALHDRGHALERALGAKLTEGELSTALRALKLLRLTVLRAAHQEGEQEGEEAEP
jgi:DNA-binding MarR family transcriptional regulator